MNAKLTKGQLTIDIVEVFESMDDASKAELIESLACQDAVIRHVADQIASGWTENGYSGARLVSASPEPRLALDAALREVAKASGEVARREIERLEESFRRTEERLNQAENELRELRCRE